MTLRLGVLGCILGAPTDLHRSSQAYLQLRSLESIREQLSLRLRCITAQPRPLSRQSGCCTDQA